MFPATATQACWDQNITDLGARKWTQLVVISAARYKANGGGINYINPDFNDNGGDADIHLAGDDFLFNNLRNTVHYFNGQSPTFDDYLPLHGSTDKATRYTICVKDNGNGTVTHPSPTRRHRRQRHRPRPLPRRTTRVHHPRRQLQPDEGLRERHPIRHRPLHLALGQHPHQHLTTTALDGRTHHLSPMPVTPA